jgi:predicted enzyme related to lactoylglutathione lyase
MAEPSIHSINFILYVTDQTRSTQFYAAVLGRRPTLDVPGMTEFELPGGAVLGLMPVRGIRHLLRPALDALHWSEEDLHAELYITVDDAEFYLRRAIQAGGRLLSEVVERDWGHRAGYLLDPDGYVVAFGQTI